MKLMAEIVLSFRKSDMPKLVDEFYSHGVEIQNINFIEENMGEEKFSFSIIYGKIDSLSSLTEHIKSTGRYKLISAINTLEKNISGGMIRVTAKSKIETDAEYDMEILGASNLIQEKIENGMGPDFTSISKSVCLLSGIKNQPDPDRKNFFSKYAFAEKEAVIVNLFSGLNAYPLIINYAMIEDLVKTLKSIEQNYSAVRILDLADSAIHSVTMIQEEISLPVLSRAADEIPLYILMIMNRLISKNKMAPSETAIGIIGLEANALRLTALLKKSGFSRILGFDNNEKLTLSFENISGLATTTENIFNNADILILLSPKFDRGEYKKIRPGQYIISFLDDADLDMQTVKERGARELIRCDYNNLSLLFPGLLRGMVDSSTKALDDELIIKLASFLHKDLKQDYKFPEVFSGIHGRIYSFLTGNPLVK